MQNPNKTT